MPRDLSLLERATKRLEAAVTRADERWWDDGAKRELERARKAVAQAQRDLESAGQQVLLEERE